MGVQYVEVKQVLVVRDKRVEERGMVMGLAKGVVGILPVVWRLAGWL